METSKVFPQFQQLPIEIRLMIWQECLPSRVIEIDFPADRNRPYKCTLVWPNRQTRLPPALTKVCRESRYVALKHRLKEEYPDEEYPDDPIRWFSPRLDTVFMHWKETDTIDMYPDINRIPELFWYADRCRAAGIDASIMHEFDKGRGHTDWKDPFLEIIAQRNDYLVCLEVVTIHATRAAAAESGLFGLLLDAPIQLVDATDTSKIAKFHELWASNSALDTTPASFFRDQVSFQVRVRQWLKELVALWVYYPWMKAWKDKWRGVIDPEGIWLGPRIDEDGFLRDMLIPGCLESDPGPPFCVDYNLFSPNMDHPFVQEALVAMPQFRPRVMFRYCPLDCHLQKQGGMSSWWWIQ